MIGLLEAMLTVCQNLKPIQVVHDLTHHDVLQYLAWNGRQGNWTMVGCYPLVPFLDYRCYVQWHSSSPGVPAHCLETVGK